MRVLLGWELGAGQGHIQRLVALAERLELQGWQPIFALRHCSLQGNHFPWQWIAAPRPSISGQASSYTFADILAAFGFAQADTLHRHLAHWQDILKTIQPDLVIADYAPGLVLGARGRIPTVVVGSHFAVPPPLEVFPAFRPAVPQKSIEQQQQVSKTVRQVIPLDSSLGEALNGDRSFIFSIPELDLYQSHRSAASATTPTAEYVSVQVAPLIRSKALAKDSHWSYLSKSYPAYDLITQIFKTETQFQPLQEALQDKSIAIHHGGLTTAIACLLAGIPQIILPRYIEQQLNGAALVRLGVAQMVLTPTEENLRQAQMKVLSTIDQAQDRAKQFADWNQNFLDGILETCFQLCQ